MNKQKRKPRQYGLVQDDLTILHDESSFLINSTLLRRYLQITAYKCQLWIYCGTLVHRLNADLASQGASMVHNYVKKNEIPCKWGKIAPAMAKQTSLLRHHAPYNPLIQKTTWWIAQMDFAFKCKHKLH